MQNLANFTSSRLISEALPRLKPCSGSKREIGTFNGNLSFWVDSTDYGIVEITHEAILHSVI